MNLLQCNLIFSEPSEANTVAWLDGCDTCAAVQQQHLIPLFQNGWRNG